MKCKLCKGKGEGCEHGAYYVCYLCDGTGMYYMYLWTKFTLLFARRI